MFENFELSIDCTFEGLNATLEYLPVPFTAKKEDREIGSYCYVRIYVLN